MAGLPQVPPATTPAHGLPVMSLFLSRKNRAPGIGAFVHILTASSCSHSVRAIASGVSRQRLQSLRFIGWVLVFHLGISWRFQRVTGRPLRGIQHNYYRIADSTDSRETVKLGFAAPTCVDE